MLEMDQFLKEFGRTLKSTRKQMGLSQVTAAQNMRIDYRHYQNIEGGKINLRLDTMMKLVKFYNLDKLSRPFNLDSCLDLLSGFQDTNARDNWGALHSHYVDGGHAGYVAVNCRTKAIEAINEKLYRTLGYAGSTELIHRPVHFLMMQDSAAQFDELIAHHVSETLSKPFITTFRTQPPAFPIPMMAVVKPHRAAPDQDEVLHCIFFDRRTLDDDGHRLKDILNGYQQFMELYPQLRAV